MCRYLFISKFMFWVISIFSPSLNELCHLDPNKMLFQFQLWRLFTAPLITMNYFSSFCLVVPVFLLLFICPMEWNKGTLYSIFYFNTHAMLVCLVKSAVWLPLSLSYVQKEGIVDPWWIEFGHGDVFACIALIELYKYWM